MDPNPAPDPDLFVIDLKNANKKINALCLTYGIFCVQGKWAERNYKLCDRYIPYALGGGYILGSGIIRQI
jgi:hypothetical protein